MQTKGENNMKLIMLFSNTKYRIISVLLILAIAFTMNSPFSGNSTVKAEETSGDEVDPGNESGDDSEETDDTNDENEYELVGIEAYSSKVKYLESEKLDIRSINVFVKYIKDNDSYYRKITQGYKISVTDIGGNDIIDNGNITKGSKYYDNESEAQNDINSISKSKV